MRFEKSPITLIFILSKEQRYEQSINFIGQPIFTQLLKYVSKSKIDAIALINKAYSYTKSFTTYKHLIVMLYSVFEGIYMKIYQDTRQFSSNSPGSELCCRKANIVIKSANSNAQENTPIFSVIQLCGKARQKLCETH